MTDIFCVLLLISDIFCIIVLYLALCALFNLFETYLDYRIRKKELKIKELKVINDKSTLQKKE